MFLEIFFPDDLTITITALLHIISAVGLYLVSGWLSEELGSDSNPGTVARDSLARKISSLTPHSAQEVP